MTRQKPTTAQVEDRVRSEVGLAANLDPADFEMTVVIADLGVDHIGFVFLALALRAYIKLFVPAETLLVAEVEKTGLTVQALADLVRKKIG